MDARLLDYYERELAYLRELGGEFAAAFPNAAGHLGMRGGAVSDPYVERLLEGFSFLSARIHLKMDAEFPRFTQRLLDIVYPNYLAPLPSMAIVAMQPNLREGSLLAGYTLPTGTPMRAGLGPGEQTPCEFRTAHEVTLWPLTLSEIRMGGRPVDLPLARMNDGAQVRGALHLRLDTTRLAKVGELPIERLGFFLSGPETQAFRLLERILGDTVGVVCHPASPSASGGESTLLAPDAIRHEGFDATQALLPHTSHAFQGYRLLHEYFAFPARYLFFSIGDLRPALQRISGDAFVLTILFKTSDPELERSVDLRSLALHCTPAINLFPKRTDRIAVSTRQHEHHLVVDRTRPLDYEVHSVAEVTGHEQQHGRSLAFRPLYGALGATAEDHGRYFSTRREPRVIPAQGRRAPRSGYVGSELFVSLVDQHDAPFPEALRHIGAATLCTNRDLPLSMPLDSASDFTLRISAPVTAIKAIRGPTSPRAAIAENDTTWRLIGHLGLNYLTLADLDASSGAKALRELLGLYAGAAVPGALAQIEGIRAVTVEAVTRQLPQPGPLMFGRGVAVSLLIDELAFAGASPWLFGAVMEQFFARHVSLNSFSELVLVTLQRGEIRRWPARIGRRPTA